MARVTRKELIEESGLSPGSADVALRRLAKKAQAKGEPFGEKDPDDSNRLSFNEAEAATIREVFAAKKEKQAAAKAAGVAPPFPPRPPAGGEPPEPPDEPEPGATEPPKPPDEGARAPHPREPAEPPEPRTIRELARKPGPTIQPKPKAPATKADEKKGEFLGLPVYAWLIIGGVALVGLFLFLRSRTKGKAGQKEEIPAGSTVPPPPPNPYRRGGSQEMTEAEFKARYPELFSKR